MEGAQNSLESVIDVPLSAITLLSHAPPHPNLCSTFGEEKETDTTGQLFLCAIFGFFMRVTDYFSFPSIPNDFLLMCKIMQRVCMQNGGVHRQLSQGWAGAWLHLPECIADIRVAH